jgi:hypothetical protein
MCCRCQRDQKPGPPATLIVVALGFALAHGQQFSTNCTDVKVEIVPDPSKLDTVCIVTVNGNVTYQRQ